MPTLLALVRRLCAGSLPPQDGLEGRHGNASAPYAASSAAASRTPADFALFGAGASETPADPSLVSTVEAVNPEDAGALRQEIRALKARVRQLEGSAAVDLQSTIASLPARTGDPCAVDVLTRSGSKVSDADKHMSADSVGEGAHAQALFFRTYDKKDLVELLRTGGKPAAAVLLQAVCEDDVGSVPPGLLLDVDPAVGEAMAGAPELMAAVASGRSLADLGATASMEQLPAYLRLRLYMMQACAARPMLAHATTAARNLFEVRSDRQLQLVLEAQVQQDTMLAMLLQELLDELLGAMPVPPDSTAAMLAGESSRNGGGSLMLHPVSHFVNTSNARVFPFVPVSMRSCGYQKSSGEVVPCVILEFAPDSNKGAFLQHLQRDYTMMGRMTSIITLFTLKGDVLHQNAGSVAYYGYRRDGALRRAAERDHAAGRAAGGRQVRRSSSLLAVGMEKEDKPNEPPVLNQLFQLSAPDTLSSLLESMVQGGVWKSILPVPVSLAPATRVAMAAAAAATGDSSAAAALIQGAMGMNLDPDCIFTADANIAASASNAGFGPVSGSRERRASMSRSSRADVYEGSFGLSHGRSNSKSLLSAAAVDFGSSSRGLQMVPEQSREVERMSANAFNARSGGAPRAEPAGAGVRVAAAAPGGSGGGTGGGARSVRAVVESILPPAPRVSSLVHSTVKRHLASHPDLPIMATSPSGSASGGLGKPFSMMSLASAVLGARARQAAPRRAATYTVLPSGGSVMDMAGTRGGGGGGGGSPPGSSAVITSGLNASFASAAAVPRGLGGGSGPASTRQMRIRRRSALALEGMASDALSQSTWGLFGMLNDSASASRSNQLGKSSAGNDDEVQPGDGRARSGSRAHVQGPPSSSQPRMAAATVSTASGIMPVNDSVAGGASTSGGASGASHAHALYNLSRTPSQPSYPSQQSRSTSQQFNSQWQMALQSQTSASNMQLPGQSAGQSPPTYVLQHQQPQSLQPQLSRGSPSPSITPQVMHSPTNSGLSRVAARVDGQSPGAPQHHTLHPLAVMDHHTPSRSAGSVSSPGPSAAQHLMEGPWTLGTATSDSTHSGNSRPPEAGPSTGGGGPSTLGPVVPSGRQAPSHPSTSGFNAAPTPRLMHNGASNPQQSGSFGSRQTNGGSGGISALTGGELSQHSSGTHTGTTVRRPPSRQSERSMSNLMIKSATGSFSFGSRAGSQRPLVRMMSFLNGAPPTQQQLAQLRQSVQPRASSSQLDLSPRGGTGRLGHPAPGVADAGQANTPLNTPNSARFPSPSASLHNSGALRRGLSSRHLTLALAGQPQSDATTGELSPRHGGGGADGCSDASIALRHTGLPQELVLARPLAAEYDGSGGGGQQYHEVTATSFLDPVSRAQVVMCVQTDVTARVRLERRLADVMEAEHKLLENIFPRHVLEHIALSAAVNQQSASQFNLSMLNAMPDPTKTATDHEQVTILFSDIVGFTSMCKEVPAKQVMKFLNSLYTRFDTLLDIYGVYKVETIGDCYMVAGGLISKDSDGFSAVRKGANDKLQAWRVLSFAKAMLRDAQKVLLPTTGEPVKMRVGIHTGPVVSGIVGMRMPRFCLFGDTINTASRMESTCPYGRIQVSDATHTLVPDEDWEPTGGVEVKGKGIMETFLLRPPKILPLPPGLTSANMSVPGPLPQLQPPADVMGPRRMATNAAAHAAALCSAAAALPSAAAFAAANASAPGLVLPSGAAISAEGRLLALQRGGSAGPGLARASTDGSTGAGTHTGLAAAEQVTGTVDRNR